MKFSKSFFNNSSEKVKRNVIGEGKLSVYRSEDGKSNTGEEMMTSEGHSKKIKWEGAIVAVVGLYDKGKTFVLNNLSSSNLPSGKKVNTKGLSFKYVNIDEGTKLILLDTAGSYSPVKVENNLSIIEREATEHFILELVFDVADYFLFVVNDFTSLDQRYLDKLSRSLQSSPNKTFREVIVIHNFKEVESTEILEHLWQTQVQQIYTEGSEQFTLVAAKNPLTDKLEEKKVKWFKSPFTRHVCIVNHDSILGLSQNPWTFSLLRYWLKAVLVPLNREFSVVDNVINFSNKTLSQYFKVDVNLSLNDTDNILTKKITNQGNGEEKLRLPQISIDSSGFVMTRPDSFLPSVDIIRTNKDYIISMDVPGMFKEDIQLSRNNVVTIVKGVRKKNLDESTFDSKEFDTNERKFGEFTLNFKIPDEYHRKWHEYTVENGVLTLKYEKDDGEE